MGPGPPDPRRIPSYLLIVGGPETIPFNFQYDLGVQYRVGRIAFESPEQYAQYAQNVLDVESGKVKGARRATFFNPTHPGDRATEMVLPALTNPVYESLSRQVPLWQFDKFTGPQANKDRLRTALSEEQRTSFLFAVSHGMSFSLGDLRKETDQGALLCSDWPGIGTALTKEHYFSAADVDPTWDLRGLVVLLFVEYGVGTPASDDFASPSAIDHSAAGNDPSLSRLATSLLGRRNGALAVIGHVDRTWTTSFQWSGAGPQPQLFEYASQSILKGQPVSAAMRYFSSRYAELAAQYMQTIEKTSSANVFDARAHTLRIAMIDARNHILLGDPAARLRT